MSLLEKLENNELTDFVPNDLTSIIDNINTLIKDNGAIFSHIINFTDPINEASQMYKNNLTRFYLSKGFQVINYPASMVIDWSHPNINGGDVYNNYDINYLSNYFTASDLYLCMTKGDDLRSISYRLIKSKVDRIVTQNKNNGQLVHNIIFKSTVCAASILNSLFAPELAKLNDDYPNTAFQFNDGGILSIQLETNPIVFPPYDSQIIDGGNY